MANFETCKECGAKLGSDDIAIYKKMVLRTADEFLCIGCLAKYFNVSRKAIEEKIRYFRESGNCALFR